MASLKLSKVLYVDLTENKFWVEERPELFEEYVGGIGVAIKLLHEECPKGVDPFDPENPIIIATGPLNGLFPVMSKAVMTFKSPLNGALGESHAGGRLGVALSWAGYGALVIKGAAEDPVYLAIHGEKVRIKDARGLWGTSTQAVGRVLREIEPGSGVRSIIRIGPAGENLVRYANINVDSFRHFGRLGAGAVMGAKKLKAIVVSGTYRGEIPKEKRGEYYKLFKEIYDDIMNTEGMKKYHDLGTAQNVLVLNALGGLPTKNLRSGVFEHADGISGEYLAERLLIKKVACTSCPIGCIHVALLRQPLPGYDYETLFVSYDYEPLFALGSLLGVGNADGVLTLIEHTERLGLDAMYAGVALAWATEAMERGLIPEDHAMGLNLKWGEVHTYVRALEHIAKRRGKLFDLLADGLEKAVEEYGGKEFALIFGGNGMPGYHNGLATHLGYLIGARHSHLDNAGYSYDQGLLKSGESPPVEKIVDNLIKEEAWRCVTNSLVMCLFARKIYTKERVLRALNFAGYAFDQNKIIELGHKIYKLRWDFNIREGVRRADLMPPERIFETPSARGKITKEELLRGLNYFFEKMGIPE
ncbi:MAG TPA: aldehyde:ferredoxin oxidoreductase [Euryarchaeota archaeon]|nr:aldehyde:ferredoxin oxidoreductase [Euryarchaeota archaeon]